MEFFQPQHISVIWGIHIWLQVKYVCMNKGVRFSRAQTGLSRGWKTARRFFQEVVSGQKCRHFHWGKNGIKIGFCFMENGEKFEGKPQNLLLLLKPQKLINFFFLKQFLLRAKLSSLKDSTFLFLKYLLRASWKVFLLAGWAEPGNPGALHRSVLFCAQTLPFGDVFMLRSPDTGLTFPRSPGRHGAHEAGEHFPGSSSLNKIIESDFTSRLISLRRCGFLHKWKIVHRGCLCQWGSQKLTSWTKLVPHLVAGTGYPRAGELSVSAEICLALCPQWHPCQLGQVLLLHMAFCVS